LKTNASEPKTIEVKGSYAEQQITTQTSYSEKWGTQVTYIKITPTGTGVNAIEFVGGNNKTLATLDVTNTVNKLKLDFNQDVAPGNEVTFAVTDTFKGVKIPDTRITIIGPGETTNLVTDASGTATFTPNKVGDYNIKARRAGYGPATDTLNVEAVANFSYDVSVSPSTVTYGNTFDITVTVTNTGRAQGTAQVPVSINGKYVTTQTVSVPANSQKTFTLTRTAQQVGTNTVSVANGKAATPFTVKKQTTKKALIITGPSTATVGDTITLTVTADGSKVDATVTVDDITKQQEEME